MSDSYTAVAQHFEFETEVTALARRYYEEEGRPEGRSLEHWLRAEREVMRRLEASQKAAPPAPPAADDPRIEEAMHLHQ